MRPILQKWGSERIAMTKITKPIKGIARTWTQIFLIALEQGVPASRLCSSLYLPRKQKPLCHAQTHTQLSPDVQRPSHLACRSLRCLLLPAQSHPGGLCMNSGGRASTYLSHGFPRLQGCPLLSISLNGASSLGSTSKPILGPSWLLRSWLIPAIW